MRNPSLPENGGFIRLWPRKLIPALVRVSILLLIALAFLYFRQHSMVYHPRPYDESYAYALPARGVEINYTVAGGKDVAYYIPGSQKLPKRLWLAFCGNGSLALDFAAHHRVQQIVLVAPFTTLREEAATMVGGWIARLLIESYDNPANLRAIATRKPIPRVAIFHGTEDEVIPVRMGRELARAFPFVEFFAVEGADHVSVLNHARDKIIQWMNR